MSISRRKAVAVRFSDFSGGTNLSEDSTRIRKNQVQGGTINAILRKNGALRRPGSTVKASFDLTTAVKGLHNYVDISSTERLLCGSGGKLYTINKSSGEDTEIYDLTGTGTFYFADQLDKCFVCNGTEVVKVEAGSAYQVGIDAPTGASAAAQAGGSLAVGDYDVYAGYGRDVDGTIVLYSQGQSLGTVTLTAGNQTVRVTSFAQSSDSQVNKRVIWMTDAGGSTVYRYYTAANDATTTHDVTSDSAKQVSIIYSVSAVNNADCPDFEYIHAVDGRIWGSVGNRLHYSLKNTSNAYDLERFFPLNFIDFPHQITGLFSIGINLYINTPAGIFVQPNSDVTARTIHVEKRWRFKYMNSVVNYNAGVIGLTNDGIKFFDGEKFLDYDISDDVRTEIDKVYGTLSGFEPSGVIVRRDIRTEYHLSYCDDTVHTICNNRRLVLNLDKLNYLPDKQVIAPFEIWSNGANYQTVDQGGTLYMVQAQATAPKLFIENANNSADNGIYLDDESVGGSESYPLINVCTRTELLDMSSRVVWTILRTMAKLSASTNIEVHIRDVEGLNSQDTISSGETAALWDVFLWDVGEWASSTPLLRKTKLPMNLHGYMMFVKFYQTANDPDFNILDIVVEGVSSTTRFT